MLRVAPGASLLAAAVLLLAAGCGRGGAGDASVLRLGHFPNVTHAQALVARALERRGDRRFAEKVGVRVEWYVYNAGPGAVEAILAGALDATYVGPNPALNAHVRSRGEEVRVIAGAARGGAGLVVHRGSGLRVPADFRGRRIATPQLGNTQDVACRAWLLEGGLAVTATGGDVAVVPTANPDQLGLFADRKVDGVWTVEPWVARLEVLADGEVVVAEEDALTTVLAASRALLEGRRDLARRLVDAHEDVTRWMTERPEEARTLVAQELLALTRRELPPKVLERAWPRLRFSTEIDRAPFERVLAAARAVGLLRDVAPLDRLVERP